MGKKKRKGRTYRLNLIPMLDAIFIIIFFLLMSAQFVKLHEIGSDAPNVKITRADDMDKKEPLNLTLEIKVNKIVIKTWPSGRIIKTLPLKDKEYDLQGLLQEAIAIKKNHINEHAVILKPERAVFYKKIIEIIDTLRELPKDNPPIEGKSKSGKIVRTRKLFDQVIFETVI